MVRSHTASATTSFGRRLHQTQNLNELALASIAHAGFQKMAKMLESFRQVPAL
jgi:hypothetical protein